MSDKEESEFQGFTRADLKSSRIALNALSVIIENPFVCDQDDCGVRFKSLLELEGHKEEIHDIYKCEYCDLIFENILIYAIHFQQCHPQHMNSTSSSFSRLHFKKYFIDRFKDVNEK